MKLRWLIVLITASTLCFNSCKPVPDLTEDELYGIINQIIADDSLAIAKVCHKWEDMSLKDEHLKYFSNDDVAFSKRQKSLLMKSGIKPAKLKWRNRHTAIKEYTIVDKRCDVGTLHHISFPIVSIDRNMVLIEFHEDCNCMLGGQGGKYLYKKKNGHWVKTKTFDYWISRNNSMKDAYQKLFLGLLGRSASDDLLKVRLGYDGVRGALKLRRGGGFTGRSSDSFTVNSLSPMVVPSSAAAACAAPSSVTISMKA